MNITERLVKNYTDELVYKKGEELYKYGKVTDMEVTSENSVYYNFKIYKIDAWVNYENKDEYNTEIIFNDRSGFMNIRCDCEKLHDNTKKKSFCQHVVAVLLKYSKESANPQVKNLNAVRAERLVRDLKSNMVNAFDLKKDMNIEIRYCYDKIDQITSSLEFRIGIERYYMVKNMRDFLKALETGEEIEYGKSFTFKPSEHKFRQEDIKLIEFLLENYEIESRSNTVATAFNNGVKLFNGKKAFILDKQLNRFFDIIKGRPIETTIQGVDYSSVEIFERDMPLDFELRMEKERIVLLHKSEMPRSLSSNGRYYFYKRNIYMPGEEQLKLYAPFYNAFMNEKSYHITFNKEDGDKVASYMVPSLMKIGKRVELDESFKNSIYEENLKIEVYLDKEETGVSANVVFTYGDISINSFKENIIENERGILIRDIAREIHTLNLLESFGFSKTQNKYTLLEEEKLVSFLNEGIGKLQHMAEVYYSESFKGIKLYGNSSYKSSIVLNNENLLEFNFSIEGVDKEELKDIFRSLKEKKKYYKLKKGGFIALEEEGIRSIGNLIEYLDIKDSDLLKDTMVFSKYNAFYIDERLKHGKIGYVKSNASFRELINNIRNVQDIDYKLPEHLDTVMRGYQKIGFKWFKTLSYYGFGGILADEMGLGKTLQTIAFIASEKGQGPSLVVAPTSLVYNWRSEIEKFAPELKALVVYGNKEEREELRKRIEESDIVITSYPLIRRDIEAYKEIEFRYCVLDEAQQIKNPSSMNASSVKEIKAKGYFALTGTPIENSLSELWSIFDFIMPGYLMSHGRFVQKYETPIIKNKDRDSLEQLNLKIKPFILRRFKKDVLKELPPKIEQNLVVEMTEDQKKLYAAYLAEAKREIDSEIRDKGLGRSTIKILAVLTRLRQICCDPSVFLENYSGDSGKLQALDEILEEIISAGHRVLLFSQFTTVLKNIAKRLHRNDIEYMYLDGSTKTEERGKLVKEFNEGKSSIFLISLKAGGTGLNLTGADMVIHFDPWWNPAVEDQATDRAHRIGQMKTVEVIKLIAQGTIEEKIQKLQEKKKEIIKNVIDGDINENNIISQMTQEEIEELFTMY